MFDDASMKKEMLAIGYVRQSKFLYKASWGSAAVEHFLYFGKDSRQNFVARFGLRNRAAENFGIDSLMKYGHPNYRTAFGYRDPETACSISFDFARIDKFTMTSWPWIYLPEIEGSELAVFVADFIRKYIFPVIRHIIELKGLFDFLVADVEPCPWYASNQAIRVAHIVAVGCQLGIGKDEIRRLVTPHELAITKSFGFKVPKLEPKACVDRYVEDLFSDWRTYSGEAEVD